MLRMAGSDITDQRRHYRALRRSLDHDTQQLNALRLAQRLGKTRLLRNAGRIACYLANDGEIATDHIIEAAWARGQQVYLPVLSPLKNSLYFAPYRPDSRLRRNRFGIDEPACPQRHWLKAQQLDLVLLPLVAFDDAGNRLGMGGGFYDRTLTFMRHRSHRLRPFLVGLAHEIQRSEQLQASSWDIPLGAIATEDAFIKF